MTDARYRTLASREGSLFARVEAWAEDDACRYVLPRIAGLVLGFGQTPSVQPTWW